METIGSQSLLHSKGLGVSSSIADLGLVVHPLIPGAFFVASLYNRTPSDQFFMSVMKPGYKGQERWEFDTKAFLDFCQ